MLFRSASTSINAVTYNWSFSGGSPATSTGASPVVTYNTAGTYTATLIVGGSCSAISMDSITNIVISAGPTISTNTNNISCNGLNDGSATATGSGSTSPYIYDWSTGQSTSTISGLNAGNYTVTVTDGTGCTASNTVAISEPTAVIVTTTTTVASCGNTDGTATADASGGAGGYTYVWSNGQTTITATGLAAGTYSVTATDASSCTGVINATVNNSGGSGFTATTSTTNLLCNGDTDGDATASPTGGSTPYSYLWDAGTGNQSTQTATGLGGGTYTITIDRKSVV